MSVQFLFHHLVDDFVVFVDDLSHFVQFFDQLLDRLQVLLLTVIALVALLLSVTVFKLVLENGLAIMELAKKVLHIFVADCKVVSFLLRLFLVDLVLLLAAAGEAALLGVVLVVLLYLVVVERVRALFLRRDTTLVLGQVVRPDEQADKSVDQTVDQHKGNRNEVPVGHDLFVVGLDSNLIEGLLGDHGGTDTIYGVGAGLACTHH